VAINKLPVTVNQDMKALIPLSNLLPEYLLFGLKSLKDIVVQLAGSATHGTKRLESGVILNLAIPVAPSTEQREIVRRIESAFDKIDRLAGEAKRALALVGRLDEAVLAKAFRGELVPQDPNDEPASVLLERIRAERAAAPKPKRGLRKAP
jgi:type I restriction enzyme S subunit